MTLVDTHTHIHSRDYGLDPKQVLAEAKETGIEQVICVGTSVDDSGLAIKFAVAHQGCVATVGHHPHDAKDLDKPATRRMAGLIEQEKVVAVGETGLDYYYNHSPQADQKRAFRQQIELALDHDLPLIFHVREAFDDFFAIIDEYQDIRGVVHSFSADEATLEQVLERGLFVGLNGIMTFTKDESQLAAARRLPLPRMLLETDSPFLTPAPKRGTVNQPKNVLIVAQFLATLRGEEVGEVAKVTTNNAKELFRV